MTFGEIKDEVLSRGFRYLQTEPNLKRLKRWINNAYFEVCDDKAWTFLETTKEGTAPLTISDLEHVLSVVDATTNAPLLYVERAVLVRRDPTLDDTGSPVQWYLESPTSLRTYPASADTIIVRYLKEPVELSADADVPIIPAKYHELLISGAVARAYRVTDNWEAYGTARGDFSAGLKRMRKKLRVNYDQPRVMVRTGRAGDYLG